MQKKERKGLSVAALVLNALPLATLIPSICNIALSDRIRFVWASVNMICVVSGLLLSIICVCKSSSRSTISIISAVLSVLWLLMIAGILAVALFTNLAL